MAYSRGMSDRIDVIPFDLRALEIFLAVCETGSMASAARRIGTSQPAVSLAVAELERKMASTLFDRSVRPVALTVAGGLLRQRASGLLADARQIAPLMREAKRGKMPAVRVGLVDSLCRALTGPVSNYLASKAGEVSVLSGLTANHAGELLTRQLDLFLGVDDLEDMAGLERWEILTEPYVLLVPQNHKPPKTVNELKKLSTSLPLIRFSARSQTGLQIERHLRRLGLELPRTLEFDTPFGVAASVAAGSGFAITTPLCIAEAALEKSRAVAARLPGPQVSRKLTLVARQQELGRVPRELADVARAVLGKG
jgi:DNA-binding transcriptional LysR family regulator